MDTIADFATKRGGLFYPKADLPSPALSRGPATVSIDVNHLGELCRHHLGATPTRVAPLADQGTQHALFRLTLPDGKDVIARVNCDNTGRNCPLLLDTWASSRLRAAGLPALEVYAVDLSRRWLPFDCELLEAARGVSLRDFDHDDDTLSPLLTRLGTFLAGVHRIDADGYGLLVPDQAARGACPSWPVYLNNHLDRHLAVCLDTNAISPTECATIRRLFDDRLPGLADVAPRLLHGDAGNHNVFVADGEVSCLIDWEDAVAGDPVYEVAFWATFHPERRHWAFLDGYFADRPVEPDFTDRFWLYFLRVALAKTVVRHNFGLTDKPGRPPASRRIQRAVQGLREPARAA
jgi:hypothetical protein